jgi:chromate transporter
MPTPRTSTTIAATEIRASLGALFLDYLKVSLLGFGGGIVWAHRITVEQRRWVSEAEFADIISFCQFMPGPNIIGIAVCVGAKLRGLQGAIAAFCGFTILPIAIGFWLGVVYLEHTQIPLLQNILGGVSAAASGLLIATGLRLLMRHRTHPVALLFAALAFAGMVWAKLPLLVVLLGLAPFSIAGAAIAGAARR